MAINTRAPYSRLIIARGSSIELRYRYEGWVQYASRSVAPRVDLAPLAARLTAGEESGGRWIFDGVEPITPRLHLEGAAGTSMRPGHVIALIEEALRTGPPAWNPYE
jgi:hypothetical protein